MKYVALLRGINVVGRNTIKMAELREMFRDLDFSGVESYIASGNVIFESTELNERKIIANIENNIESRFSLKIEVMLRKMSEIVELIRLNPYIKLKGKESELYAVFLKNRLSDENKEKLLSNNDQFEEFQVFGRDIFCLMKKGYTKSLLGKKYIDNKLKTPATVRNWRTVNKIAEF